MRGDSSAGWTPQPLSLVQSHKHGKMMLGWRQRGSLQPLPHQLPYGSSKSGEGTACLPLCSRDPEVTQQGGLWGGAYSLALGHLTQRLQLLGTLGQPHPTVTLKPQWDLLRQ